MGKHSQYGVILDAGSSGTRVYIYKWKNPAHASEKASIEELHRLPKLKLEKSKKIHPGVSTFADNIAAIGEDHLKELIAEALDEVPEDKVAETPIFLLATAGVRFLEKPKQTALLQGICTWLQENTQFYLPDCDTHIQVIPGETEGLYGWIAANYLLGGFDHPQSEVGSDQGHHHTFGFLDMGGASAQIAFAPNSTEAEKHADDLKLVRMRHLDGTPAEYRVFTTTWLGYGANKARDRYVESLKEEYGQDLKEMPDPCMPHGLVTTLDGEPILGDADDYSGLSLVGTGEFDECLHKTYPLLGKDMPCEDTPCLINGQHVPGIDFNINHFVGVSEYWHTTHGVFGGKKEAYDLETYQERVNEYCSSKWSDIMDDLDKRGKSLERKAEDARQACFKASWLINMLYDGIGIPRLPIEGAVNGTKDDDGSEHSEDSFRPVDKVDGVELSWTLGKMVLYAAGQVQPEGTPLPVGFGSNVASGKPADFEEAGSVPLLPSIGGDDDDDDDDDLSRPSSHHFSGLIAVIALLLVAWYFLRKPETRRRIMSFTRRRRPSASSFTRRPLRGFPGSSLASKLFGRNGLGYERVMEEGEAPEFELSGGDSDENEHSDSSEGSRGGRTGNLSAAGRLNGERFADELQPPNTLDRKGLAVRTESRDRLATVGRRSRAGSPQRSKSSLMTPMDE